MNHFLDGAFYPAGGAKTFADSLIPVIRNAGEEVRVKIPIKENLLCTKK